MADSVQWLSQSDYSKISEACSFLFKFQGFSKTYCTFHGILGPGVLIFKFKDFQGAKESLYIPQWNGKLCWKWSQKVSYLMAHV